LDQIHAQIALPEGGSTDCAISADVTALKRHDVRPAKKRQKNILH
jgi:hypothetical protein